MKNTFRTYSSPLLICFLLFCVLPPCFAQKDKNRKHKPTDQTETLHYGWFAADAGYNILLEDYDDLSTLGGGRASVSLGYELQHDGFYFSLGAAATFWTSSAKTEALQIEQLMRDTQGKNMTFKFNLPQGDEFSYGLFVSVPIVFGYTFRGWCFGGGARVGYHLLTENASDRKYSTSASYSQYFEDFEDMPNHFYTDYKAHSHEKLTMTFPVSVLVEGGYNVLYGKSQSSHKMHSILRIGFYAEYGFIKVFNNEQDLPYVVVNKEHPTQLDIYAYYNRKSTESNFIFPLSAGIKVTYMLRIPTRHCNCYN